MKRLLLVMAILVGGLAVSASTANAHWRRGCGYGGYGYAYRPSYGYSYYRPSYRSYYRPSYGYGYGAYGYSPYRSFGFGSPFSYGGYYGGLGGYGGGFGGYGGGFGLSYGAGW